MLFFFFSVVLVVNIFKINRRKMKRFVKLSLRKKIRDVRRKLKLLNRSISW